MKFVNLSLVLFGFLCFNLGCQSLSKSSQSQGRNESDLTWELAKERKARLSEVKYHLAVVLNETELNFTGNNRIQFQLSDASKSLRLDFFEGSVSSLKVNGEAIDLSAKKTYWIDLPAKNLKVGANVVEVRYTAAYSREGAGLHRFQDPETKEVFLYSQFETYDANRFFPCFDQPDLRSIMNLKVEAPATWQVITSTAESEVIEAGANRKAWTFPPTDPLSTYIFSLHAGPYKIWKDSYQGLSLRIFARPSMAKYVDSQEWFKITKQGLKFFNSYFGVKYPFQKYDQLFVPEFNAGAMENVGAVTFSERFLKRAARTRNDRRGAASVILHEMAHMWFGNLVTMAWWNDLWLNESFASYMAALALTEATEYKESWQDFFGQKTWAYWEDGLVTTHPIESNVTRVKEAFATFDGITYGKGASVLKQLAYYMGAKPFRKGIQQYIKTHSYKNTEQKDFIAALQTQTTKDLNVWATVWLQQSGTDRLTANWTCEGDKLSRIKLLTTPSAGAKFRPQSVDVGLFKLENGKLQTLQSLRAEITGPETELSGNWKCPSFVYPNFNDYGYLAVNLDPQSLKFARANLMAINDTHLRQMVWDDLWQMVRSGNMPLREYVSIVNEQFNKETDMLILNSLTSTVSGAGRNNIIGYWPDANPHSTSARLSFIQKTEQDFLNRFKRAKAGSDEQKFWFDQFIEVARSDLALKQLKEWLNQDNVGPGFPLDLDRRWNIARQIARFEGESAKNQIEQMKAKDTSDRGVRQAYASEAIQPVASVKQKWMESLTQSKLPFSFEEARSVLGAIFPYEQAHLAKPFEEKFYSFVKANAKIENENFLRTFASRLSPVSCEAARSNRLKKFVAQYELAPTVTKALKVNVQEDERCQMIRLKSEL